MTIDLSSFSKIFVKSGEDHDIFTYFSFKRASDSLVFMLEPLSLASSGSVDKIIKDLSDNFEIQLSSIYFDKKISFRPGINAPNSARIVFGVGSSLVYFFVGNLSKLSATTKKSSEEIRWSEINFYVADKTYDSCLETARIVCDFFSSSTSQDEPEEDGVDIYFIASSHGQPAVEQRKFPSSDTDNLHLNYPPEISAALNNIQSSMSSVDSTGKLILMHGSPGTGKTSVLKILTSEWKNWACFYYILDPEMFFADANYMRRVLFLREGSHFSGGSRPPVGKKKILLIEDADEFLREDSKRTQGQSMARFLNLTDGFMGQGIDFLMAITTNESIQNINKAILRPGRCLADLHFRPFTRNEAKIWLDRFGKADLLETTNNSEISLAELYAMLYSTSVERVDKPETFAGTYL